MNCRYVESRLSCYVDGELTGREMLLIREHLASCPECDHQVQEFASMKQVLGSLQTPLVRSGFEDELVTKVLGHCLPQPSLWDRVVCAITRGNAFSWGLGAVGVIAAVAILFTPEHQNLFTKGTSAPSPAAAMAGDQKPYILPSPDDGDLNRFQFDHSGSRDVTGPPIPLSFETDSTNLGH
jgi:hypothetical protein